MARKSKRSQRQPGGARDIEFVDTLLSGIERAIGRSNPIGIEALVETLMGRKPELRFRFIQDNAQFAAEDLDV
ncbi:hypothetical protein [uncultured Bradyrhizobium sp.]|uniref:hypothetical protein n=1 Tax=uncultured Bradyrhizobium sp. TaxID=199684 RepID=UPI00261B61B2|nr:hypothetical protein [uncultured Bradyrhizobium sp.]